MERYVIFIRKNQTGEEFVSARMATTGQHEMLLAEAKRKYPEPTYNVLTAYTQNELEDIVESVNRWCGALPSAQTKTSKPAIEQALLAAMAKKPAMGTIPGLQKAINESNQQQPTVAAVEQSSKGVTWG